jgi:hypothetical protein
MGQPFQGRVTLSLERESEAVDFWIQDVLIGDIGMSSRTRRQQLAEVRILEKASMDRTHAMVDMYKSTSENLFAAAAAIRAANGATVATAPSKPSDQTARVMVELVHAAAEAFGFKKPGVDKAHEATSAPEDDLGDAPDEVLESDAASAASGRKFDAYDVGRDVPD